MKSVKCPECGFVGWADADRCKKCGVIRMADPAMAEGSEQFTPSYRQYQPSDRYFQEDLKKGMAVAALVIGILNLFTLGMLGVGVILGIVLAIVALNRAKRNPQEYGGQSLATAGLILSIISAVIIVPIGIVAAIAIPNLLASRRAANEGATVAVLRKIHAAEATYQATMGRGEYGTLDQLLAEQLINSQWVTGSHYGYKFAIDVQQGTVDTGPRFQAVAVPITYGNSGIRSFYIDETGVIRGANNRGAVATDLDAPLNTDGYSSSSPPSGRYRNDSSDY